ncbi:MAG: HAD family hydrolase [Arcobacter sp.]|uniref:phosphoglycolate phosphatase n=1 Tax=Arcobacter defluvii TaxID=873191 RepID=A0AAE7E8A0_9BACT|nr:MULTISPECIES: HAD family hydrolase [Arcobacter]MDY3200078.1 HAD family hydrolase [Arcobacter sp.]QKF78894.1 phosphoglycolate phosphatase [Arcobacter defluvii]RXI30727.1 HAD family hydrolase [Arcobacter defluvii]
MAAGKKTIIFDLDGTLLDSIEDIAISMNKVLKELNLPIHKIEDYKYFVGSGVDVLVENALKESSQDMKKEVSTRFKKEYDQKLHENTKPYEGIYELLDELKKLDYNLAVLSNKPHDFTVQYVDYLFKDYGFKEVHGQKVEVPRKPDPIGAINIAKALNIPCEEIFFVGDTLVDMKTAKSAGMKAIGVLWGFRDEKELNENGADFIVKHPLDILEIVKK